MNQFKRIKELEKKVSELELVLQEQPKVNEIVDAVKKSILKEIETGAKNITKRTPLKPITHATENSGQSNNLNITSTNLIVTPEMEKQMLDAINACFTSQKRNEPQDVSDQKQHTRMCLIHKKNHFSLCLDGHKIKNVIAYQIADKASETCMDLTLNLSIPKKEIDIDIDL